MSVKAILVADDEKHLRSALFTARARLGHEVELAENGREALSKFQTRRFDLVVTDHKLPGLDGLGLLKALKKISPDTPVIVMTACGTVETAVEAMREGAHDFILKPFPTGVIEGALNRAFAEASPGPLRGPLTKSPAGPAGAERPIITRNGRMKKLMDLARSVAASPATVLLQGESGTGKELLARYIHHNSPRSGAPFVAINCASLPESLLESELFGHEKGAFTGAAARKQGKFELADGGSILLDEISEMDIGLQAKLLRVLQEGEIDRVGGKEPQKIDVRVIATTNRNLKEWVEAGKFRADLYYRLNVIPFYIPALKERKDDVPELAEHFRKKYAVMNNKNVAGLSGAAIETLCAYDWPGNIRELENTVARGVLLASDPLIEPHDLFMDEAGFMAALERGLAAENEPPPITRAAAAGPAPPPDETADLPVPNSAPSFDNPAAAANCLLAGPLMTIEEMERRLIGQALNETEGNRTHAARILGISVRTLRNKLAEYRVSA
ncbi:MAG: sigma-54 dependent transcriptional regulator [Candidatus Adiutrix sp.]|jgi:two-component system response regulator FlrC|nr:sigma-54 dependent transcriptional regulator [Candidatus Adiutrix sp.]